MNQPKTQLTKPSAGAYRAAEYIVEQSGLCTDKLARELAEMVLNISIPLIPQDADFLWRLTKQARQLLKLYERSNKEEK